MIWLILVNLFYTLFLITQQSLILHCPAFIFIQEGFSHSFPLPPHSNWRPSSNRPPSLTSRLLCCCQRSCEEQEHNCCLQKIFPYSLKMLRQTSSKHSSPLDPANGPRGHTVWLNAVCGWEREDGWNTERERAVRGTEMRAQHVAWCVTMATAVCLPKITIHTRTHTQ